MSGIINIKLSQLDNSDSTLQDLMSSMKKKNSKGPNTPLFVQNSSSQTPIENQNICTQTDLPRDFDGQNTNTFEDAVAKSV